MRFSLPILHLGKQTLDRRWLDPAGRYELPFGQAAPVCCEVKGGTEYETVGVIDTLLVEDGVVEAMGEIFSDLAIYKGLIDGDLVLSVDAALGEYEHIKGVLRIQSMVIRGALVIRKVGWAW